MKSIYLVRMHVKYFFKKGEHNVVFEMPTVAETAFEINKYPHSVDFIKKHLPKSKNHITFRVTKMEKIKYLGESFAYE
jgi:hypothetical protein